MGRSLDGGGSGGGGSVLPLSISIDTTLSAHRAETRSSTPPPDALTPSLLEPLGEGGVLEEEALVVAYGVAGLRRRASSGCEGLQYTFQHSLDLVHQCTKL